MLQFKDIPGYTSENWEWAEFHLPDTPWIQELEAWRQEWYKEHPPRTRDTRTIEQRAAAKRKGAKGGDINHRFEGERYVNCDDKHFRRLQLRKLVDEGGEVSVGGQRVSHPTLSRWEAEAYGVSPEEIAALEKADADPESLIIRGWWCYVNRTTPWQVSFGSSMAGEGGIAQRSKELMQGIEEDAERLRNWGIKDVERALLNRWEHAGIDVHHAKMAYDAAQQITNDADREQLKQIFKLRVQGQTVFSG